MKNSKIITLNFVLSNVISLVLYFLFFHLWWPSAEELRRASGMGGFGNAMSFLFIFLIVIVGHLALLLGLALSSFVNKNKKTKAYLLSIVAILTVPLIFVGYVYLKDFVFEV